MQDAEYVKSVLSSEYETERDDEIPYPNLDEVIDTTVFDYLSGTIDGQTPNGRRSREGNEYLWFKYKKKSILSHRFIAAVTLGKWVPRDFDVDHVNHIPCDNRPNNLRIVTRRDNAGNRRKALLSELVELSKVSEVIEERQKSVAPVFEAKPKTMPEAIPKPVPLQTPKPFHGDPYDGVSIGGPIPARYYTGETKPAKYGGKWHKTNLGSWHLLYD